MVLLLEHLELSVSTSQVLLWVWWAAANACLFTTIGEAMIVAITIIAAIVVVFFNLVFIFVGVISTMDKMISNHVNKEGGQFQPSPCSPPGPSSSPCCS